MYALARQRKMFVRTMKTRKVRTWKARPPRRMWFAGRGSFLLLSALPMSAAPVTWTAVAMTSQVMKMARMTLGGSGEKRRPLEAVDQRGEDSVDCGTE